MANNQAHLFTRLVMFERFKQTFSSSTLSPSEKAWKKVKPFLNPSEKLKTRTLALASFIGNLGHPSLKP